MNNVLR